LQNSAVFQTLLEFRLKIIENVVPKPPIRARTRMRGEEDFSAIETGIRHHQFRAGMKNVTIVLDEKVADWARIEAASSSLQK
jgi:hypothetical protein